MAATSPTAALRSRIAEVTAADPPHRDEEHGQHEPVAG